MTFKNFSLATFFTMLLLFAIPTTAENSLSGSISNELSINFVRADVWLWEDLTKLYISFRSEIVQDSGSTVSRPRLFSMEVSNIKIGNDAAFVLNIENARIGRYNYQMDGSKVVKANENFPKLKNGTLKILKFSNEIIELSFDIIFENGKDLKGNFSGKYQYMNKHVTSKINNDAGKATADVKTANANSDENKLSDKSDNTPVADTPHASSGCGLIKATKNSSEKK